MKKEDFFWKVVLTNPRTQARAIAFYPIAEFKWPNEVYSQVMRDVVGISNEWKLETIIKNVKREDLYK